MTLSKKSLLDDVLKVVADAWWHRGAAGCVRGHSAVFVQPVRESRSLKLQRYDADGREGVIEYVLTR